MSTMRDYYEVLNVDRTASQEDIKRAFRRLAREYHPDVKKDDPQANDRFKEINEAYQVLSDPDRRAQYDRYGTVQPFARDEGRESGLGPFDDIFEMFFGRQTSRREREEPQPGADLRYDLEISLEEAASGVEKTIELDRLETCSACFGTGAERGSAPETCPSCRGAGQVRYSQQTIFGSFTQIGTCRTCRGSGKVLRHPCKRCRGSGRQEAHRTLTVKVPPGVDTGNRLRLSGEGEVGELGGARGDLYVFLHLRPHTVFERNGLDLSTAVRISITQAALGDEIEIPTLDGPLTYPIPPSSQPGTTLTISGKGMPHPGGGGRGNLHVHLDVRVPTTLSAEERRLLLEFAKLQGQEIKPQKKKLTDKVKELLQ